ncbi:MAG TPA: UDP-N-acetylmuramate dehydrogenase [Gammaproteobacteria bacterium]|nr:UDP-N-acetylmuramate dehydrogenase [Gammaproteobacteria bacterium]
MNAAADAKPPQLRGVARTNECLARHTVWGIGGPAERFYEPADVDDLALFLSSLPAREPIFWLGLGSNLLVRDGGIAGTVIYAGSGLGSVDPLNDDGIRAGAGAACPKVAKRCAQLGLAGAEFFAGIPGTLGGALAMNAGAFGGETWSVVDRVQTVDRQGRIQHRQASEYRVGYRSVDGPENEWFVAAELKLERDAPEAVNRRLRALLKRRSDSQPMGYRSCGSVFRNPPGDFAARLIEASGLKGTRIGDAAVSEKHANFILNLGEAKAADVESLIQHIAERVRKDHGVALQREVHIVGRPAQDAPGNFPRGASK